MSVLVVGLSHKTAPLDLVERAAISPADTDKVLHELKSSPHVAESVVVSTCNRVEIYSHVSRFHAGVQEVSELIARVSGIPLDDLAEHLYVHYEERAVQHLFTVACGLDSMVVGEGQIQGQIRTSFQQAQDEHAVGRVLSELFSHSLRVGKRARTETAIGGTGASLVSVGLDAVAETLGTVAGRSVLLVGAGAMGKLAAASLRQLGCGDIVVANRTEAHGHALAATFDGSAIKLDSESLERGIAGADLVVSSTGSTTAVITADLVEHALRDRDPARPLMLLDLALPRDVEQHVRQQPGVTLVDLETLRHRLDAHAEAGGAIDDVRRIVADEVAGFLGWQRASRVAPTVTALRAKADDVIALELDRLAARLPDLGDRERSEVASAVRRVVEKLLHAPTVRVKELAAGPGGDRYAEALRELFELDPSVAEAVAVADLAADLVDPDGPASRA